MTGADASLAVLLKGLKLPSFVAHHEEVAEQAERGGWPVLQYLRHLVELELGDRERRKIERLQRQSHLPEEKTLGTLEPEKQPAKVRRQLPALCEGGFVDRAENLLAFGLPGRGKTHTVCAVGHELVKHGYSVLFTPAFQLVQKLLRAKRDLELERQLRRLDRFDLVIVDDIGYIQQDREEMEVLFTFLSERYERRSLAVTSNLVFSQWDRIFKDPMTTAAAIDRIVHHSVILEMTGGSIRNEHAQEHNSTAADDSHPKEGNVE